MNKVMMMSKEEFEQWLKEQLEERVFMHGYKLKREDVEKEIYTILFEELQMCVEDIERLYLPFGQAGFWTIREKFELMVYVMEKEYYDGARLFLESIGQEWDMTENEVEDMYSDWALAGCFMLSEDEKKEFTVQCLADHFLLNVAEVLNRIAKDGFLLGELCPPLYEAEPVEHRVAVYNHGGVIRLPFLGVEEQELIRIIKGIIARENKGELTFLEPVWECVREDGTCITAVRPPAGQNWGLRVLYGAAGKDKRKWQV